MPPKEYKGDSDEVHKKVVRSMETSQRNREVMQRLACNAVYLPQGHSCGFCCIKRRAAMRNVGWHARHGTLDKDTYTLTWLQDSSAYMVPLG